MALDPVKNFAIVTVSTGYDASATSIALSSGHGARLPAPSTDGAFNLVWWNSTDYANPSNDPNVEIVRCTARSTDTLTVTRGQESISATTKNTADKTYKMMLAVTAKMVTDIQSHPLRKEEATLTDGATISMNGSQYFTGRVTLGATGRTLNINNMQAGQVYRVIVKQDGTGSRTITTWNCYTGNGTGSITLKWAGGSAPTLTTTANKADIVTMLYADSTVWADCVKNF